MMQFVTSCDVNKKNVFLRIDGNVPVKNGMILDDFRLRAVIPTIEYILQAGATKITIGTHIGRPHGIDKTLSVTPLAHWFAEKKLSRVHLLENLRFDPREKKIDIGFARELAANHDVYINDAWGVMHRAETSLTLLPTLFSPETRAYGLLVKQELAALTPLREDPKKPYIVFLGGSKLPDKLDALFRLIDRELVTTVVLLPGIVFTFLAAQGCSVGTSLVFPELFERCRQLQALANKKNTQILIPEDFLAQDETGLVIITGQQLPATARGITVGPKAIKSIQKIVSKAETIFYNGAMGFGTEFKDDIRYQEAIRKILTAIAQSNAYTIIGGGDSVAAVEKFGLTNQFTWCSTGGGSTLDFISGALLPGLQIR